MSEELDIYEWQGNDLMHIGVMDKREAELKDLKVKIIVSGFLASVLFENSSLWVLKFSETPIIIPA